MAHDCPATTTTAPNGGVVGHSHARISLQSALLSSGRHSRHVYANHTMEQDNNHDSRARLLDIDNDNDNDNDGGASYSPSSVLSSPSSSSSGSPALLLPQHHSKYNGFSHHHPNGIHNKNISPSLLALIVSSGWLIALFVLFPFPTTVHAFLALSVALVCWAACHWLQLLAHWERKWRTRHHFMSSSSSSSSSSLSRILPDSWRTSRRSAVLIATIFSILIIAGSIPRRHSDSIQAMQELHLAATSPSSNERYFIATNMYNAADGVLPSFMIELTKLAQFLGPENVFISIAESNSQDGTKPLLQAYARELERLKIPHRISIEDNTNRWWPYGTSPERVTYLAGVRNKALEPLQSKHEHTRLSDAHTFTKVVFLNDVYYKWQAIVRLINTQPTSPPGENDDPSAPPYDLACATDYGHAGLYDTWVARDICGIPMRAFWPYVRDAPTIELLRKELPFEVAACWNGAVVFPTGPYLPDLASSNIESEPDMNNFDRRGWKMMDNASYPHTWTSPELASPLKFRGASYEDACDHSECFLFSYDIHRLNAGKRRPRIYMNPKVKVAYDHNWYRWQNTVLELPLIRFWLRVWSRGPPLKVVDWLFERLGRYHEYCTWAGFQLPDHCDPLPGPLDRGWAGG